jgi:hypothetical protein
MKVIALHKVFRRDIILHFIFPTALLALLVLAIVGLFGQPFFQTVFLPGGRGSIEYAYLANVAEKFGYSRFYTFYVLLAYLLFPAVGNLLMSAKIAAMVLLATYLVSLYLLSSLYSSRWLGFFVLPTVFLPFIPETLFKGDFSNLTTMVFAAVMLVGLTLLLRGVHTVVGGALSLFGSSILPFSDPGLLPAITMALVAALTILYLLKRQVLVYSVLMGSVFVGMVLLSVTLNSSISDDLWRPNPLEKFTSNIIIGLVSIVSATVGIISLYSRRQKRELVLPIGWILVSVFFSVFQPRSLILAVPMIAALIPSSLIYWRKTAKLRKIVEKEMEPYYEVEIDLDAILRVAVAALTVVLLILAMPSAIMLGNHEAQPQVRIRDIEIASQYLKTISSNGLIVAHPSMANWLSTTSGLLVLPTVNRASFEIADLLTTTSFRIITPFLKVDDWEPFSTAKAPLIHVYDGKTYRPILYVDDSYSWVSLVGPNGEEFIESPYKARFLGHEWSESEESITLKIRFQSAGLFINKTIVVNKAAPVVKISYSVKAFKEGWNVKSLILNVYSVPLATLPELNLDGSRGFMRIETHSFIIDYSGDLERLSQDKTKDQRYTTGVFRPSSEVSISGTVTISSLTAISAGRETWYSSFIDLAKELNVKYVIVPKEHQVFLKEALPTFVANIKIKDSFVQYIINSEGKNYIEAPAYALVLSERTLSNGSEIWYKTSGLVIRKIMRMSDRSVDIMYEASPHKERTYLVLSTLSAWIDWDRTVSFFSVESNNRIAKLALDSASFTLQFKGNVSHVVLETHPEYKQLRIHVTYSLNPSYDFIGLSIESDKPLTVKYVHTTRPEMKDEDLLTILTEVGVFRPVKELELYTIYEITLPLTQ